MSDEDFGRQVGAALREMAVDPPPRTDLYQQVAARVRRRRQRGGLAVLGAVAVLAVLAVVLGPGFRQSLPTRTGFANRWQPGPVPPGAVTTVYGTVDQKHQADRCMRRTGSVATAPTGPVYLSELTCVLGVGADEPGRSHPSSRQPYLLQALRPDGRISQLWPAVVDGRPFSAWAGAMAVGPNGTLYVNINKDGNRLLARHTDGRWQWLTASPFCAASRTDDCQPHVTAAGSPARSARLQGITGIAVGPDRSVYLASDHTVLRISPDGIIRLVAGTLRGNRLDSREPPAPTRPVPATSIALPPVTAVAVTPTGMLFIATPNRLYTVDRTGTMRLLAQRGHRVPGGACCLLPGGRPVTGPAREIVGMAADPRGGAYLLHSNPNSVLHVNSAATAISVVAVLPRAGGTPPAAMSLTGRDVLVTLGAALIRVGEPGAAPIRSLRPHPGPSR